MQKSKIYTIKFAVVSALIASSAISFVSFLLKDKQRFMIDEDKKRNILKVSGLNLDHNNCSSISKCFEKNIHSLTVDINGHIIYQKKINPFEVDLYKEMKKQKKDILLPIFIYKKNNEIITYIIPIAGKGLWSTIKGYISFEKDLNTIHDISFYEQGETAGLGGEIQSEWFRDNFKGKKIFSVDNKLVSVKVMKSSSYNDIDKSHAVDGITGATLTGKGVTRLLKSSLELYESYFKFLSSRRNLL